MRHHLWQKALALVGMSFIGAGGVCAWWFHDPSQGVVSHQAVSMRPSVLSDRNSKAFVTSVVETFSENTSAGFTSFPDATQPEVSPDRMSPVRSQPALPRLAKLLEAARHGMERSRFDEFFDRWLHTANTGDVLAALTYLPSVSLENSFLADLNARLIRRLSETDVNLALSALNAIPEGAARVLASENLAVVWANEQLPAAVNWASQLPAGIEREHDLFAVASEAVRVQPAEALRLADELPPSSARDELVSRAIGEWAVTDPVAATSWSQNITDDTLREQALASATTAWSSRDPAAAGAFALAELTPGRLQDDAVVGVAQRWAQQSPSAAAAWVQSFPGGALKTAAASSIASIWKQSDTRASEQWLAQIIGP